MKVTRSLNPRRDRNSKPISICSLDFHIKLAMCKAILGMDYFGFTFCKGYLGYPDTCQKEKVFFKHQHCDKSITKCWGKKDKPHKKIRLFRCPQFQFKDLETDKIIVVPLEYFISGSDLPDLYFSYVKQDDVIYPQKYADNVKVKEISLELEDNYYSRSIECKSDNSVRQSSFLAIKNMKEMQSREYWKL